MASKYWFAKHPEGRLLQGSVAWDPASIADDEFEAKEITIAGASLGDFVIVSFDKDLKDVQLTASVTAADTVTAVMSSSAGAQNVDSGTCHVLIIPNKTYYSAT